MTYSRSRIDAHQNGDCDNATCPLCELEDTITCPGCGNQTTDTARCDHTDLHCPDCNAEGFCHLCDRECAEDIADDIATERALDEWRGLSA